MVINPIIFNRTTELPRGVSVVEITKPELSSGLEGFLRNLSSQDQSQNLTNLYTELKKNNFLQKEFLSSRENRESIVKSVLIHGDQNSSVAKILQANQNSFLSLANEFLSFEDAGMGQAAQPIVKSLLKTLKVTNDVDLLSSVVSSLIYAQLQDQNNPQRPLGSQERFGYKLCDFLIEVGGAKLAQAIDSYDSTPDSWREGLNRSKESVEPLSRDKFELEFRKALTEVGNKEMLAALNSGEVKIGEASIGTGAYLDTFEIKINEPYLSKYRKIDPKLTDKDAFVVQVVKPNAVARADKAYDFVLKFLNGMKSSDTVGDIGVPTLISILSHYKKMLPEETKLNNENSISKSQQAHEFFTSKSLNLKNNVPGTSLLNGAVKEAQISFETAKLYEAGDNYRISKQMRGVHFDQMPIKTIKDLFAKFYAAVGLFTVQLFSILSGGKFDHDRHGANQSILVEDNAKGGFKIKIGIFDELGICDAPSKKAKETFANMLMDAVGCGLLRNISLDETIKDAYNKLSASMLQTTSRGDKQVHETVDGMLKTLVSATDYQKFIDRFYDSLAQKSKIVNGIVQAARGAAGKRVTKEVAGSVYEDVLKAIVATSKVDPVIANIVNQRHKGIKALIQGGALKTLSSSEKPEQQYKKLESNFSSNPDASAEIERMREYPRHQNNSNYTLFGAAQRMVFNSLAKKIPAGDYGDKIKLNINEVALAS